MKKNPLAEEWFQKGDDDLKFAKIGLEETEIYSLTCFLAQQAAEKYLKGYLTLTGRRFPKTHFLKRLLKLAEKENKNFIQFQKEAKSLDKYYIAPRYPIAESRIYTKGDASLAIQMAEEIIEFIKTLSK